MDILVSQQKPSLIFPQISQQWHYLFVSCKHCSGLGHSDGQCPTGINQSKARSRWDTSPLYNACQTCGGIGHYSNTCTSYATGAIHTLSYTEFFTCEKERVSN